MYETNTIELKKAIQLGYEIKKIYALYEYTRRRGIFKNYIERLQTMKIENSGEMNKEDFDNLCKRHEAKGLNIDLDFDTR